MSEGPPGNGEPKGRAPDIDLRDGPLRSVTWLTKGEYELLSATSYTRAYRDENGEFHETTRMRGQDHAPLRELIRDTRAAILDRNREYKRMLRQEHVDDRDPDRGAEPSAEPDGRDGLNHEHDWRGEEPERDDARREQFEQDRQPRRTRSRKPRDRSAR